jgi:hypothetical protein
LHEVDLADRAVLGEKILEIILGDIEGEVPDV